MALLFIVRVVGGRLRPSHIGSRGVFQEFGVCVHTSVFATRWTTEGSWLFTIMDSMGEVSGLAFELGITHEVSCDAETEKTVRLHTHTHIHTHNTRHTQVVELWASHKFLEPQCGRRKGPDDTCRQYGLGGNGTAQYKKVGLPSPSP